MNHTFAISAQAGVLKVAATTNLTIDVTVVKAAVPIITITPMPVPNLLDSSPAGTVVCKATVTNTDGTPYTGTLTITSQTSSVGTFVLARVGTTNVWDVVTTAVVLVDGLWHVSLNATE